MTVKRHTQLGGDRLENTHKGKKKKAPGWQKCLEVLDTASQELGPTEQGQAWRGAVTITVVIALGNSLQRKISGPAG